MCALCSAHSFAKSDSGKNPCANPDGGTHPNGNAFCAENHNATTSGFTATRGVKIERAYFVSPVVDMEKLISDMMAWAGVSEERLRAEKEIQTNFGETLSYKYLCYVRENPVRWNVPTHILYGENDNLQSVGIVTDFAKKTGASLTVMKGGEHWFHTSEQMKFLDEWIKNLAPALG